ncbi:MAG: DUF4440 domain-containing protein [Kiritimatiellae bacterium]|nr:DUF4440 domain-containing protein [Kiritimatiellia bacterium]
MTAVVAAAGWWWRRPREERWLKRELFRLCHLAEKHGEEPLVEAARRAERIAALMSEDVRLSSEHPWSVSLNSRREAGRAILEARAALDWLSVAIEDLQTRLAPDRATAEQRCTVRVCVRGADWSDVQARELSLRWRRESDGWRIAEVRVVEVIRPLPAASQGG